MFTNHGVILLKHHFVRRIPLVLVGSVVVTSTGCRNQFDFVARTLRHNLAPYTFSPRALTSVSTESMPFLSMILIPFAETRKDTKRFSLSTQKR
jgi:hypothetical protein